MFAMNTTTNNMNTIKLNEYVVILIQQYGIIAVIDNYIDLREGYYAQKVVLLEESQDIALFENNSIPN